MIRTAALAVLATISTAHARPTVTLFLTERGERIGRSIGMPYEFGDHLTALIGDAFGVTAPDVFLRRLSDATGFSQRGMGVDYTEPSGLVGGVSVGTTLAGDSQLRDESHPTGGRAANFNVMIGLNLSRWGRDRWTVFANSIFQRATLGQLNGLITNLGAHVQYRAVAGSGRWLGVSLTSGLEYARWKFNTGGGTIRTRFEFPGGETDERILIDSVGHYALQANVATIPLEASTGARLGRYATVFGGAAIDLNVSATSGMSVNLDGILRAWDDQEAGSTEISGTAEGSGHRVLGRLFAGAQVKVKTVALFAQANAAQTAVIRMVAGIRITQ